MEDVVQAPCKEKKGRAQGPCRGRAGRAGRFLSKAHYSDLILSDENA